MTKTATQTATPETSTPATVLGPDQFTELPGPPNAPFVRKQCFDDGHVWMGVVTTEPGCASPWHHHGDYDTLVYMLEGEARVEFGDPSLEPIVVTVAGSMARLPKGLVHREINCGSVPNKMVVFRVGSGQPVFPVDLPNRD